VRLRGQWEPGPFSFGRWSTALSVAAVIWAVFQFLNIAWPRNFYPDTPYLNWSVAVAVVGLAVLGTVIYLSVRSRITTFGGYADEDDSADTDHRHDAAGTTRSTGGGSRSPR
jgi:hypothetical protein